MINKKKDWLQLSQRQRMSPFPNYLSMESITREMRDVIGVAYREVITMLEHRHMYVFIDRQDHERVGMAVLQKVLAEPAIFVRLLKTLKQYEKSFYKWLRQHNSLTRLRGYTDARLAALHREYERRYRQVYSTYFPILAVERYLFEYLRDYIYTRESHVKKASIYLDRLITERRAMVNWQEQRAALLVAQQIYNKKKWRACFLKRSDESVMNAISSTPGLYRIIKQHERQWYWITRDYEDPILTYGDFIIRFRELLKHDPAIRMRQMEQEDEQLAKDIQDCIQRLQIDSQHVRLFQTMREGIYYKEYRKSVVSRTLYLYDPILSEIARRGHLSMAQARHLKVDEISALLKGKEMTHILNDRIRRSVWHARNGRSQVFVRAQAGRYFKHLITVDPHTKRFVGMPVSPGMATGPVKVVINPSDFPKVKKGDVIATIQATPVFTRVLSIASALICDGGPGITSHPATLAREAGIPGIIGLATTTKVLKDGMRVSVDGNSGVVQVKK